MANPIESTPRERLARLLTILKRTRMYWRSSLALILFGTAVSLVVALNSKRAWRSETTVLYRESINTRQQEGESAAARAARLGPKLKDYLLARPRLTTVIQEFDLYPQKTARSMIEALDELSSNVSFKARASDTYVISFVHEDPVVTQKVTTRLAELMISDYNRETVDSATMTRDFLRRELDEANKKVDESSRALATFLAQNPQFQWGLNDNPYGAVPGATPGAPPTPLPRPSSAKAAPSDPELASLEQKLSRVDAELAPPRRPTAGPVPAPAATVGDAQKQRDAAAAAVAAAEASLAEKLATVTPAHPNAVAAKSRVEAAQRNLAAADAQLKLMRSGGSAASAGEATNPDLSPERKASLEKDRSSLLRQIADRRSKLASSGDAAPKSDGDPKAAVKSPKQDVVELETEWHRLKLDLERARDHLRLTQVNERAADMSADAAEKKSHTEMMVLDPAYLPMRPDRGRGRVFFIGITIALFFAFGLAGARVLLNDTLYDPSDVAASGAPTVLVALPRMPSPKTLPPRMIVPSFGPDETLTAVRRTPVVTPPPVEVCEVEVTERPARYNQTLIMRSLAPAPKPAAPRRSPATLRWGSQATADTVAAYLEANGAPSTRRARASGAALALVPSPASAMVAAVLDEPEIEVIGADADADAEGAHALLHASSADALAALRVLRHRLDQRRGQGSLVVSVVSPGDHEGKTTLATRLALILSEADRARVVLVEGNLERPRVAETLGLRLPEGVGLSAQIRARMMGKARPWGVVKLSNSLAVLAEPGLEAGFPGALHSTHFDAALRTLQRNYDYVVIDGPTVLGSGDANVIEDVSDGVLLVAKAGSTKGTALCRSADQLGDRRILGVVLNGALRATEGSNKKPGRRQA